MKFSKEFLLEEVLDSDKEISCEIIDTRRWSIDYYLVFKHDEKFYGVSFSRGATEQQDERPFEYEPNEIECQELRAVEKTVIVYEPVS